MKIICKKFSVGSRVLIKSDCFVADNVRYEQKNRVLGTVIDVEEEGYVVAFDTAPHDMTWYWCDKSLLKPVSDRLIEGRKLVNGTESVKSR